MGTDGASIGPSDGEESEQRLFLGFNIRISFREPTSRPWFLPEPFYLHESASVFHISIPHLEPVRSDVVEHQVIQSPCGGEEKQVKRGHPPTKGLRNAAAASGGWEVLYHEDTFNMSISKALCRLPKLFVTEKMMCKKHQEQHKV